MNSVSLCTLFFNILLLQILDWLSVYWVNYAT